MSAPPSTISTGLNQLDTHLNGGYTTGSLVTISGSPHSPAQRTFLNLLVANTTYHLSFNQIHRDSIRAVYEQTDRSPANYTRVEELLPPNPEDTSASHVPITREIDRALESLSDTVSSHSVIALSPVNFLEQSTTQRQYHSILQDFRSLAENTDSIAALLAFPHPSETPNERLLTQTLSDYLVTLSTATEAGGDRDRLELAQVRPTQTFAQDRRVFPLTRGNYVDINTEEEVSLQ